MDSLFKKLRRGTSCNNFVVMKLLPR